MATKVKCPLLLQDYIQKAIAKCGSAEDRDFMRDILKRIVEQSKKENSVFTRDWSHFSLPMLPSEGPSASIYNQFLLDPKSQAQ